jgi:arylsulfatase A-like enzyme
MRVLMLDIDGLQPAYIGPYGCEWVPTPTLDRWAAAGVVFDQHFADCPEPTTTSWRTGRHALAPGTTTVDLLADLRSRGVRTARIGPSSESAGWDIEVLTGRDADAADLKPTRRAVRQAIEQIGDAADAFLRVKIESVLPPWPVPEAELAELLGQDEEDPDAWAGDLPARINPADDEAFGRLQWSYAAAVATFDNQLAKLLADCRKRGWGKDALWILTAGRGFPLGEHGPVGFADADVHEELVHLSLMMRWPHDEHAGTRVGSLTQPADLAPTLRQVFGLPFECAGDPWMGRSLVALACGGDTPVRDRAVSGVRLGEKTYWGYRTTEWYLMVDGERRLFVKPDDRWEVNDVQSRNQELAEVMEREFKSLLAPGQ